MTETAKRDRSGTLPAPGSISEEAHRFLAAAVGASLRPEMPALDDVEGWLRSVEAGNARLLERVRGSGFPERVEDREIGGVRTFVIVPEDVSDDLTSPIYLDIHGGALVFGGGEVCREIGRRTAMYNGMVTWAADYRMPPLHPYPAALDDCMAVYRALLEQRVPEKIFVGGSSAGGNLAAALTVRARDEGLPLPAGLVLISPELDLTESGDSFVTNLDFDVVLQPLMHTNLLYAGDHDLSHPYLSPLFADVTGFPPTFLQAGTRDLFLSNAVRMHRKLRDLDIDAELHIWEGMPHGGFGGAPEDLEIRIESRHFLDRIRRSR